MKTFSKTFLLAFAFSIASASAHAGQENDPVPINEIGGCFLGAAATGAGLAVVGGLTKRLDGKPLTIPKIQMAGCAAGAVIGNIKGAHAAVSEEELNQSPEAEAQDE